MSESEILAQTARHVQETLAMDATGHDWWHTWRVRGLALHIGRIEDADLYVVELAALLHDIADWKLHDGDSTAGPRAACEWLERIGADVPTRDAVCSIIERVSFKGARVSSEMPTLEGKVVQDADRLDALGAIGIARTFAYGGHAGRAIHDPAIKPAQHSSAEEYRTSPAPTINHFYEKLLLLRDRMNTKTGRDLAEHRHRYMEDFLNQFFTEWNVANTGA
jgi:uncharacterized protein